MKIAIVVGTRPEIIKMFPVIKACQDRGVDYRIINTQQHYSENMNGAFLKQLDLPVPAYNLNTTPGSHGQQIGSMLVEFENVFNKEKFDFVLVQGDTNSVLAGAVIASRHGIPVGHVEAGLRSRDRTMPEEINRLMVDQLSDLLFAPSDESLNNLLSEGIGRDKAFNTGNTIVDATLQGIGLVEQKDIQLDFSVPKDYILLTLHRPANVDNPTVLQEMFDAVKQTIKTHKLPVIFPIHPRTYKQISNAGLHVPSELQLVEPVGYLEFLKLESQAQLIMTDSGGIQEEACIMHVPCVTLRDNTERPETVAIGANMLGGTHKQGILDAVKVMIEKARHWNIPYGQGNSAQLIVDKLGQATA